MSSSGSAPVSPALASGGSGSGGSRSIDVEFNLLRTWSDVREDLHRRRVRALALLGLCGAFGAAVLPALAISAGAARRVAAREASALARAAVETQALEAQAASAAAPLARRAALTGSRKRADATLRVLASIVESCPRGLRIVRLNAEVASGAVEAKFHAAAPDAATARAFLVALSRAPRVREVRQTAINGDGKGGVELDVALMADVQAAGVETR